MLNNFKNKYLGKQVEFHSFGNGAYNQCVDLVNQYIKEVLNLTPIIGTNAKDFKDKFNPDEFEWIVNTPEAVIKAGDIPVWNGRVGGGVGHIAIALEDGDVNKFISLDQNWSQVERVTVESHTYANVTGWLRSKKNQVDDNQKLIDELRTDRDKNWNLYNSEIEKNKQLSEEVVRLNGEITELKNANTTLLNKIEYLTKAQEQDAIKDRDLEVKNTELEHKITELIQQIEDLKKQKEAPIEPIVEHYENIIEKLWPNLYKSKKTKSLIDRIWKWIS